MAKLKFAREAVEAMLATVLSDDAEVMLVKDDGVYLMSFGDKPKNAALDWKRTVAYARGFDPSKDEDVWDKSRDAMGGDDGGDKVGTKKEFLEMLADSVGDLIVTVTANSLQVGYIPKGPTVRATEDYKPLDVFKGAKTGKWRVVHSVGADNKPVLYAVAFAKKAEATSFVKTLKANPQTKAAHDAVVARTHAAGRN